MELTDPMLTIISLGWRGGVEAGGDLGGGDGSAPVVALAGVAAAGGEDGDGLCVFDAFGDDLEAEVLAEIDDGSDDDGVAVVGAEVCRRNGRS